MNPKSFSYLITAVPTPFYNNKIDFQSFEKLLDFQYKNNVEAVVVAGSTGEGMNLSNLEWYELIEFAVKYKNNKKNFKIIAGCGSNSTFNAVNLSKEAEKLGVDAILSVVPYYNKPQQNGIYTHFKEIANSIKIPIILYNVPGRTVANIANDTIVKLTAIDNIIGIKDATGDLSRVADLRNLLNKEYIRSNKIIAKYNNFNIWSGEDITQIGFNAMGGTGVISVVSNIMPKLCYEIQSLCQNNKFNEALLLQNDLTQWSQNAFCDVNPVAVKYMLKQMNIFKSDEVRLPLVKINEELKNHLQLFLNIN